MVGHNSAAWLLGMYIVTLVITMATSYADWDQTKEQQVLGVMNLLKNRSDPRIRPNYYGPPVHVDVDLYVQNFGPLNEVDMEFQVEIFLHMQWQDPRLDFSSYNISHALQIPVQHVREWLWNPDVYFPNEKNAVVHNVLSKNEMVMIYPDGKVWTSVRLTLHLHCGMDLDHFPLDHQTCTIKISSYSYDNTSVVLHWLNDLNPIEITTEELELPQFELMWSRNESCEEMYRTDQLIKPSSTSSTKFYPPPTNGSYPCLKAAFHFHRQVGFHILSTYIPSHLIVIISWVSFWINKDSVPARITLTVTTILTMTTQVTSSRSGAIRVSYARAIDVWYAVCMLFVFGAMIEYVFVNVLARRERSILRETIKRAKNGNNIGKQQTELAVDPEDLTTIVTKPKFTRRLSEKPKRWSPTLCISTKSLDKVARIAFPIAFVSFDIVYWCYYRYTW